MVMLIKLTIWFYSKMGYSITISKDTGTRLEHYGNGNIGL